ncbi:hypothetical protein [Chryseobacterium phocaeense]|nr:hypothetical protein [Chryseobacterium phocaeense]
MLDWYFDQTQEDVWLGTTPKKRELNASTEKPAGWKQAGMEREKLNLK